MVIETINDKKLNITLSRNYFENLDVLVNYIRNTQPYREKWSMASELRPTAEEDFWQLASLDAALDMCFNYSSDLIEEIGADYNFHFPHFDYSHKREIEESCYGFRPNVNKALRGSPTSMYKLVRKEKKKIINLNFNAAVNYRVSKEKIVNRGIITIFLIKALEQIGIRCNLNYFMLVNVGVEYILIQLNLKEPSQLLDAYMCVYPFCHSDFLRRVFFAVEERVDTKFPAAWRKYYGNVCNINDTRKILDLDEREILIGTPKDLGIVGASLDEDIKNYLRSLDFSYYFGDDTLDYDEVKKSFVFRKKI